MGAGEVIGDSPVLMFAGENLFLESLVGGAAVADEFAAARLHQRAGGEAGAGDGDERVAGFDAAAEPCVEAVGDPLVEAAFQRGRVEASAAQQGVGGVKEGKGADKLAGQALALEARPRPGGVDAAQMVAAV